MRSWRALLALVGSGTLVGLVVASPAQPAQAAGVWVEVSPGSVTAGSQVQLRADCGDNSKPATVRSTAFPSVAVHPQRTLLGAEARVRASTQPGTHDVTLTCQSGSTSTTTLLVFGQPSTAMTNGPHTGGGFLAAGGRNPGQRPAWWFAAGGVALAAVALVVLAAAAGATRRR
ncbi:MAG: hypothetical protein ACM30G_05665 [Micromonosporaceae bacterium]